VVNHLLNIIYSVAYYYIYLYNETPFKDAQNRIDALDEFTVTSFTGEIFNLTLTNYVSDLLVAYIQSFLLSGHKVYVILYLATLIYILFDVNFKNVIGRFDYFVLKILCLSVLLFKPIGYSFWEHHTVFVVIFIMTLMHNITRLPLYTYAVISLILDPLSIVWVYLRFLIIEFKSYYILLLIILLFYFVTAGFLNLNYGEPSLKFLFIMSLFVCTLILMIFLFMKMDKIVLQYLSFLILLLLGLFFGLNVANRVFVDYAIFMPLFSYIFILKSCKSNNYIPSRF